jgi:hypothetical protein
MAARRVVPKMGSGQLRKSPHEACASLLTPLSHPNGGQREVNTTYCSEPDAYCAYHCHEAGHASHCVPSPQPAERPGSLPTAPGNLEIKVWTGARSTARLSLIGLKAKKQCANQVGRFMFIVARSVCNCYQDMQCIWLGCNLVSDSDDTLRFYLKA